MLCLCVHTPPWVCIHMCRGQRLGNWFSSIESSEDRTQGIGPSWQVLSPLSHLSGPLSYGLPPPKHHWAGHCWFWGLRTQTRAFLAQPHTLWKIPAMGAIQCLHFAGAFRPSVFGATQQLCEACGVCTSRSPPTCAAVHCEPANPHCFHSSGWGSRPVFTGSPDWAHREQGRRCKSGPWSSEKGVC